MSYLFFHFDGTNNHPDDAWAPFESDQSISNVLKSHLLLGGDLQYADGRVTSSRAIHSFYYAGIGTYGNALERWLNAGFAFENADVATILNRALLDFHSHYHKNTRYIVLIGFSRGAALARRFATLITPLVAQSNIVLAVMDTVASIGWPNLDKQQRPTRDVVFEHGRSLAPSVVKALHLLALDEQRLAFRPTLMNHDERVTEVWLAGAHSDVGGGYRYDGLADNSFVIMKRWLQHSLRFNHQPLYHSVANLPVLAKDPSSYRHWLQVLDCSPKTLGILHDLRRPSGLAQLTLAPRRCYVLKQDRLCSVTAPLWHRSVYLRMQQDTSYRPRASVSLPALGCYL